MTGVVASRTGDSVALITFPYSELFPHACLKLEREQKIQQSRGLGTAYKRSQGTMVHVALTSPEVLFEIQIVTRTRLMCAWACVYAHTYEVGSRAYCKILTSS